MSEQRLYDMAFTRTIAREQGILKDSFKSKRFELYSAGQFKMRIDGINFNRGIPARRNQRSEFYKTHFRVRINQKWHSPKGLRYEFFTMDQVAKMLLNNKEIAM